MRINGFWLAGNDRDSFKKVFASFMWQEKLEKATVCVLSFSYFKKSGIKSWGPGPLSHNGVTALNYQRLNQRRMEVVL